MSGVRAQIDGARRAAQRHPLRPQGGPGGGMGGVHRVGGKFLRLCSRAMGSGRADTRVERFSHGSRSGPGVGDEQVRAASSRRSFRNRWTLGIRFCNITGCPSSHCPPTSFIHISPSGRTSSSPSLPVAPTGRRLARTASPLLAGGVEGRRKCRRKRLKRDHSGRYPTPRCGAAPAGLGIFEGGTQEQIHG